MATEEDVNRARKRLEPMSTTAIRADMMGFKPNAPDRIAAEIILEERAHKESDDRADKRDNRKLIKELLCKYAIRCIFAGISLAAAFLIGRCTAN